MMPEPSQLFYDTILARLAYLEGEVKRLSDALPLTAATGAQGSMTIADEGSVNGALIPFVREAYVTANQNLTNIRQYPDVDSEMIRQISQGETLISDATFNRGAGIHIWYRIKGGGFVRGDVVTFSLDKPTPTITNATWSRWDAPIDAYTLTSTHGKHQHRGVDLAAPIGTPVHCGPHGGYIAKVFHCAACGTDLENQARMGTGDPATGYGLGNYVVVRYSPLFLPASVKGVIGDDAFLYVLMAHLSKIRVQQGAIIEGYALIGDVGTSGNSTGSHLHIQCCYSPKNDANFYSIRANEIHPDTVYQIRGDVK